ncbi:MAG: cell wall-active antibiotics response protein [Firmicutes bacterium]|nr:cell wall-active antibiotics response protein [Bacillota bacterium]
MSSRLYWGAALVLIGLLLLASNVGLLAPFSVWGLWPILVIWPATKIALGLRVVSIGSDWAHGVFRVHPRPITRLVAAWVALGATAELLNNVGLIRYDWGDFTYWTLPALLVAVGVVLVVRRDRVCCGWVGRWRSVKDWNGGNVSAFAGEIRYGHRPWDFKSPCNISVWAGDIDLDLSTARFQPGTNRLHVNAWAADVDIRAPEGIEVYVQANCAAGELEVFDQHRSGLGLALSGRRRPLRGAGLEDIAPERGGDGESEREAAPVGSTEPGEAAGAGGATVDQPPKLYIHVNLVFGDVRVG